MEEELSDEFSINEILETLPVSLKEELADYIRACTLETLDDIDGVLGEFGQILQLFILSEYSILQFGVLLKVLAVNELVLANDSKDVLQRIADNFRNLSGHIEMMLAPTTRH